MNRSLQLVTLGGAERLIALQATDNIETVEPFFPTDPLYSIHEEE
jgi:hypothetical protein